MLAIERTFPVRPDRGRFGIVCGTARSGAEFSEWFPRCSLGPPMRSGIVRDLGEYDSSMRV